MNKSGGKWAYQDGRRSQGWIGVANYTGQSLFAVYCGHAISRVASDAYSGVDFVLDISVHARRILSHQYG